ncbi:polysaccharide deacetylase family protein [Pelobium manganitolerans]|uniref:polysaccharide deacetylase family protein n=1 Tax=Pelobium manganitolerans TaxID=1842495 RepID=UPI003FA3C896
MALWVYTEKLNARIAYVFKQLFGQFLGVEVAFCTDADEFATKAGAKICYASQALGHAPFFKKHPFIDEVGVATVDLTFADWEGLKIPFAVDTSALPFDVFAASFYLLSRYEEYLDAEKDVHGRYPAKASLAFKNGFLNKPLVDEWALLLSRMIKQRFPEFETKPRAFRFIPTLDIDRPYYFRNEGFLRKAAKYVLNGFKKDPFDIYEQVRKWDKEFGLQTQYFFLMGNKHANDVSPGANDKLYQKVIKEAVQHHHVGLHPSYYSNQNSGAINKEKEDLEQISGTTIFRSRQHYLMLQLPETYRNLIAAGIREDYTLAFADAAGFRASTCSPFFWYDLLLEQETDLLLYPTAVMDQTLRRYMALQPKEAIQEITSLMDAVKNVKGTFVSLWHNESVDDFGVFRGWKKVYLELLRLGAEQ